MKQKLTTIWKITKFKVILIRKGEYHLLVHNISDQNIVLTWGAVHITPRVFRVNSWIPGYDFRKQMKITTQVWTRIYNLLLEYMKAQNLFNVTRGVGLPLKINPRTLNMDLGI